MKIGVWEHGKFVGCIIFSRGANANIGKPYGLKMIECCELTRVALREHESPVSRLIRISVKLLRRRNPGIRLIISYADPNAGHHGGIYQAAGWIYTGKSGRSFAFLDHTGRKWHNRQVSASGIKKQYGENRRVPAHADCERIPLEGKHRYVLPLDQEMQEKVAGLKKDYPRRDPAPRDLPPLNSLVHERTIAGYTAHRSIKGLGMRGKQRTRCALPTSRERAVQIRPPRTNPHRNP